MRTPNQISTWLSHLSRMIRGERSFQPEHLSQIAQVFELSLEKLVEATTAAGLVAATTRANEQVSTLTSKLATLSSQIEEARAERAAMRAAYAMVEIERDRALSRAQRLQEELTALRRRPTVDAHEAVLDERDHLMAGILDQEIVLGERDRALAEAQAKLSHLGRRLKTAHVHLQKNFEACEFWQKEAERRGANAVKGVLVAGIAATCLTALAATNGSRRS